MRLVSSRALLAAMSTTLLGGSAVAQLTDVVQTPNTANEGIQKSFDEQIGTGQGGINAPGSSIFIIRRDPFRSIARGRQLFQRKFTRAQGLGPRQDDGVGDIEADPSLGAGLGDSCAACHSRPRGSAGVGGNVFTRPDSRDAPHLFGLGLVEMLADEITVDLRRVRDQSIRLALASGVPVRRQLMSKGLDYGWITGLPTGEAETSQVSGVDPDLRVRPFFAEGSVFSIREFSAGAFDAEMGLEPVDPILTAAAGGADVVTPSGMVLTGSVDAIGGPVAQSPREDPDGDGVVNEVPASIVDHLEFYLLNYFAPATYRQRGDLEMAGLPLMQRVGCTTCHVPDLVIDRDRRVAVVETRYDDTQGGPFNRLFATATPLVQIVPDLTGFPPQQLPLGGSFVVRGIFADFKRHDVGPGFYERNFDGTMQREFVTEPLWGVGSSAPYGHDGRSPNLREVILRHGGEAQASSTAFARLPERQQELIIAYLDSLVLFGPPDTASNLDPAQPTMAGYPQFGHGSIKLSPLFNNAGEPE